MTVLVTGFEPFEGHAVNASWLAVQELVRTWRGPAIEAVRLPVSFRRAPGLLEEAVARTRPRAVVSVGEAGGADAVLVERVALNVADARIPDEDGDRPVDEPLVPGGPAAWFTALPLRACVDAAERAGVPARVSSSAGTYVCNAVFYRLATVLAARTCRTASSTSRARRSRWRAPGGQGWPRATPRGAWRRCSRRRSRGRRPPRGPASARSGHRHRCGRRPHHVSASRRTVVGCVP